MANHEIAPRLKTKQLPQHFQNQNQMNESKQLAYAEKLANREPEETLELDPDEPSEAEMDRVDERANRWNGGAQ